MKEAKYPQKFKKRMIGVNKSSPRTMTIMPLALAIGQQKKAREKKTAASRLAAQRVVAAFLRSSLFLPVVAREFLFMIVLGAA
jgi:hypothetical protein